jgi:hypothetical protein
MRLGALVLLGVASPAHAESDENNALQARVRAEASRSYLELDPVVTPRFAGLLETDHRITRDTISIDARTVITVMLDEWANKEGAIGYRDVRGQGWQATARFTRAFGPLRFDLSAGLGDVDSWYGRGRYRDVGASLLYTSRISRWVNTWFGITAGQRRWLGGGDEHGPPAGERNGTQVMLVFGFTF